MASRCELQRTGVGTFNILSSRLTRRLQRALIAVRSKLYFTGTFKARWTRLPYTSDGLLNIRFSSTLYRDNFHCWSLRRGRNDWDDFFF